MADDAKDKNSVKYIYHGSTEWIPQANRVVKTYRSGLCMITQDFICRNDGKADYFAFKEGDLFRDSDPCIDNAYIFPEPTYQDLGNGFINCAVTAYGRVNSNGNKEMGRTETKLTTEAVTPEIQQDGSVNLIFSTSTNSYYLDRLTQRIVAKKDEVVGLPSGNLYVYDSNFEKFGNPAPRTVELYEGTSFGEFIEYVIVMQANFGK